MTERKSRIDPDKKDHIVKVLSIIIMASVALSLVLIVLTYFQREDIISEIEMAKNATQTIAFNFTEGNP